ncbi:MAG: proline racemase family protein [Planctomycetaceae bacterium]
MHRITIVDSHTGGEPTRIIVAGGPSLGEGSIRERLDRFRRDFDSIRTAVILEPRGSDVLVGGLLCEPVDPTCAAGVIFFNNAGYLQMCGHGTIGLVATLAFLKRITVGSHRIETPVGIVTAELLDDHRVAVTNVPSYRYRHAVTVNVPEHGPVTGDVAWGGNWFFLTAEHGQTLSSDNCRSLTDFCLRLKAALQTQGITGANSETIDHIELFGPPTDATVADSRNFVLCPGTAYDRSPCGTGTSAKLACLAADGKLRPGEMWRQQSIVGSVFEASYQPLDSNNSQGVGVVNGEEIVIIPTITGSAWVTAESQLLLDPTDPFVSGIVCPAG